MARISRFCVFTTVLSIISQVTIGIVSDSELYPFGLENGDIALTYGDEVSTQVGLYQPITYFGKTYKTAYVSTNGIVTFSSQLPHYQPRLLELHNDSMIAVYYADADTSFTHGTVYYREEITDGMALERASDMVNTEFVDAKDFIADALFIVTWHRVGWYDGHGSERNTFQLVIASDAKSSYATMMYGEIQWTVGQGKMPSIKDREAQAGFTNVDGRSHVLPPSDTEHMMHINQLSNIELPGVFIYRISGPFPVDPRTQQEESLSDYDEDENYDDEYQDYDQAYGNKDYGRPGDNPVSHPEVISVGQVAEVDGVSAGSVYHVVTTLDEEHPAHSHSGQFRPFKPVISITENHGEPFVIRHPRQNSCANQPVDDQCHSKAICQDYDSGFCCECQAGTYGNGRDCIKDGDSQRINGRLTGLLNGMELSDGKDDANMHTFVLNSDGRAFTAISKFPSDLGAPLLFLSTIGSVFGWMFGQVKEDKGYNGFMLTGGLFNRTVTVHIGDQHTVTLKQDITGRDEYHYFKTNVYVTGNLPRIPPNAKVNYPEYTETYRRVGKGVIKAYDSRTVEVETGSGTQTYDIIVDQQIHYTECDHKQFEHSSEVTLRVDRSYVVYDEEQNIVRYGSANVLETIPETGPDPCRDGAHTCTGEDMICTPTGNTYRCDCKHGYEMEYVDDMQSSGLCVDVNECDTGSHDCHDRADCHNTEGSFICRCQSGFDGDGRICKASSTSGNYCGGYQCDDMAVCQGSRCVCKSPYVGDGLHCHLAPNGEHGGGDDGYEPAENQKLEDECRSHEECGDLGYCTVESINNRYICACRPGLVGTYPTCETTESTGGSATERPKPAKTCRAHEECDPMGSCSYDDESGYYMCKCRPPYYGDGYSCQEGDTDESQSCNVLNNCDPYNADCTYDGIGGYQCRCREGYSGDGYNCAPTAAPPSVDCDRMNNCHHDAQCVYDAGLQRHVCQCLLGYDGDGYSCRPQVHGHLCSATEDCHEFAHCAVPAGAVDANRFICLCLPGYSGDGLTDCKPADQCQVSDLNSCPANSKCVFKQESNIYGCNCNAGFRFEADGTTHGRCVVHQSVRDCNTDPRVCHMNANCVFNHGANKHDCICKPGSRGDGYSSCIPIETPRCPVCSMYADCITAADGAHMCKCRPGYHGSGTVCTPTDTCLDDRSLCHESADCVPGEQGFYVCACRRGWHGNGETCSPDSEARGETLLIGQGMSVILRGMTSDVPGKQLITETTQVVVGIDFDCVDERVYWTDVPGHAIRSAKLDGTDVKVVVSDGIKSPEGIAVDWKSRNIYFVDSMKDTINVIDMEGKYMKTIIKDGLVNPRALAIDMESRKIYYSDWFRQRPVIGRANLDGTEREDFITDSIHLPNGLTILRQRREICWVDAGAQSLSCADTNGGRRRVVYGGMEYPFGLTSHNDEYFYWTDWKDFRVHRVSIFGENHESFRPSLGGSGKIYGIVAVPSECAMGSSPCETDKGGCPYWCLPSANNQPACACPDHPEKYPMLTECPNTPSPVSRYLSHLRKYHR